MPELRAFAERILFASSLDEKLAAPLEPLTDEQPGPAITAPSMPGRPRELRFKLAGHERAAEVPGLDQLDDARERGRLLHFFANHELLATELMALVLLRFPDAPAAFRRGVLRTLQDEQQHTRWYLERMRACGVEFGEQPVSGYFWRCVAGMENPMDYVAGLSLTFEQANLDFARHFSQGFAAVGDNDTARLLDKIYRDEIGHVAYGLKWFRRWKNPTESDWEAFCRQLKFPLSPQRAKGFALNLAGRRAAGLDPAFIAELEVYARSRGRTPGVYWFNPFAEAYIAQGSRFTPSKSQRQLAADLAHLPMFLARQDDVVIAAHRPEPRVLRTLQAAGLPLPEFVSDVARLEDRKLGPLRPWAWSPDSVAWLRPLFAIAQTSQGSPETRFNPAIAALFAKSWSAGFLRRWLVDRDEPWLCPRDVVGVSVRTVDEALAAVAAIRGRGHPRVVAKQSLGLAGQNAIRLWEPEILPAQRTWIERSMAEGGELVIEPWLERVADFSMQCEMTARGLGLVGFSGLETDLAGRFVANAADPNHARRVPGAVKALLRSPHHAAGLIDPLFHELRDTLGQELAGVGFMGPLGVDAFIYRDVEGVPRLKPVVEINPRYTMGRVALELMRHVAAGSHGRFHLANRGSLRRAGASGFIEYATQLTSRNPVVRAGSPVAKIVSGALILGDPTTARACLPVFEVRREA